MDDHQKNIGAGGSELISGVYDTVANPDLPEFYLMIIVSAGTVNTLTDSEGNDVLIEKLGTQPTIAGLEKIPITFEEGKYGAILDAGTAIVKIYKLQKT